MGAGKEKKEIQRNSASQRGISEHQQQIGDEQLGIGRENLDTQKSILDMLTPYIEQMVSTFDPTEYNAQFPDIQRPDMSGQIRRDYMGGLADIEQQKNRNIADYEDYATAGGLSRSGNRGAGLGAIVRGAQEQTGTAREDYQRNLRDEELARYQDSRDLALRKIEDARRMAGMKTQAAVAGANIAQGQQAVFNPTPYMSMGSNNIDQGANTLSQSSQGYYQSGRLPSAWSTVGGIVGQGLGMATNAASMGSGGGLKSIRNIWSGSK